MSKIIGQENQNDLLEQQLQMAKVAKLIQSATDIKCDSCGELDFIQVYRIKKVSGLVSGTGKDIIFPIQIFMCANCGHINERFLKAVSSSENDENEKSNLNVDNAKE